MFLRKLTSLFTLTILLLTSPAWADSTEITIAAFGDSLMAGYRIPKTSAMPAQLEAMLHQKGYTGVKVLNFGISGNTTADGVRRVNQVAGAQPDIVILELGANDMLRGKSAAEAKANLKVIIEYLQKYNARVILSGIDMPTIHKMRNPHAADFPEMFEDLADEYDLPLYPDFLAGALGMPGQMLSDGVHPSATGAATIARSILPMVEEEIENHLDDL